MSPHRPTPPQWAQATFKVPPHHSSSPITTPRCPPRHWSSKTQKGQLQTALFSLSGMSMPPPLPFFHPELVYKWCTHVRLISYVQFLYRSSRDTLTIHFNPQLRISNSHSRVSTPNQGIATMKGRVYKVHPQNFLFLFVYWLLQQYHDPRTCHHVCVIPHNITLCQMDPASQTNATYAIKTLGRTLCTPLDGTAWTGSGWGR